MPTVWVRQGRRRNWLRLPQIQNVILLLFGEFPSFVFIHIEGGISTLLLFRLRPLVLLRCFPGVGLALACQCEASILRGRLGGIIPVDWARNRTPLSARHRSAGWSWPVLTRCDARAIARLRERWLGCALGQQNRNGTRCSPSIPGRANHVFGADLWRLGFGFQDQLRGKRGLVRLVDPGEAANLAGHRLAVHSFGVALEAGH